MTADGSYACPDCIDGLTGMPSMRRIAAERGLPWEWLWARIQEAGVIRIQGRQFIRTPQARYLLGLPCRGCRQQ